MAGVFKDGTGRVRSGWVLAAYSACAGALYGAAMVAVSLLRLDALPPLRLDDPRLASSSLGLFLAAVLATLLCQFLFGAEVGLARAGAGRRLLLGLGLGSAAVTVVAWLPVLFGAATVGASAGGATAVLGAGLLQLCTIGPTSVGEEVLLRGVALRELSRGLGPVVAVLATGSVFGLLHLGNPEVSALAAVNIALVGVWFGALVVRTGSLWTSIGLHLAWNWFEGFVWGLPVSGVAPASAVVSLSSPPAGFWGGGAFGPEASGLASVVLGSAVALTLFWPKREQKQALDS